MGAKIQCTTCYTAYHPLCARMAGLHMEMVDPGAGAKEGAPLTVISYCPRHCRPQPELAGGCRLGWLPVGWSVVGRLVEIFKMVGQSAPPRGSPCGFCLLRRGSGKRSWEGAGWWYTSRIFWWWCDCICMSPHSLSPPPCTPPTTAGLQQIKDGEAVGGEGDGAPGLWNAQPFPPPPALGMPTCASGCARAEALDGVKRMWHGTGAGQTSTRGFWMPEEPLGVAGGRGGPDGALGGAAAWAGAGGAGALMGLGLGKGLGGKGGSKAKKGVRGAAALAQRRKIMTGIIKAADPAAGPPPKVGRGRGRGRLRGEGVNLLA